jgi:murein DD-endopeptidase MepM/ murein hydrolase activator NlpD
MMLRRLTGLFLDGLRALASLGLVLIGVTLLLGHAAPPGSTASALSVANTLRKTFSLNAPHDTLALLLQEELVEPDPIETMLESLTPFSLLAGKFREGAESLSATFERLAATPSVMPTQGWLSSNFSGRRLHPLLGYERPHLGIDVRAPRGTAIEAPAVGTVIRAGWEGGYGWAVEIDHGYDIITRYAHVSRILVEPGYRVQRGEVIALVGQSGLADGPHLHYEVRVKGHPVNPLRFVLPAVIADD